MSIKTFVPQCKLSSKIKLNVCVLVCVCLFVGFTIPSPAQEKVQVPAKQWVYEFYVLGMESVVDAARLDSAMSRMMGIYSSKTNFETKKVVVSCIPGGDYRALQLVVQSVGLVPNENYYSFKEEDAPALKKE